MKSIITKTTFQKYLKKQEEYKAALDNEFGFTLETKDRGLALLKLFMHYISDNDNNLNIQVFNPEYVDLISISFKIGYNTFPNNDKYSLDQSTWLAEFYLLHTGDGMVTFKYNMKIDGEWKDKFITYGYGEFFNGRPSYIQNEIYQMIATIYKNRNTLFNENIYDLIVSKNASLASQLHLAEMTNLTHTKAI